MLKLINWLKSCNCHDVKPVQVTIGGTTWEGCHYKKTLKYDDYCQAVTSGRVAKGSTYTNEFLYLIGSKPKIKGNVCFPLAGDAREWYVAGWIEKENITPRNKEFHPFGEFFQLAPWDIIGTKIDAYEEPYKRVEMSVKYL